MLQVKNVRTGDTLELDIPVESLIPQDAGAREAASVEFDLWDPTIVFEFLPEDEFTVSTVASTAVILFGGFARSLETDVDATGRKYHVIGYDYSTLLDRINVVSDDRPAGESDADRLAYFMTTYGSGLLDDDPAGIATLNASMPAQKFRLITLRQAIEQVLGTALATGTYRLNASKKLDTWDSDPGLEPAPYDIVLGTPGAGELAPESLSIKADTSNLFNAYWVRGATAAGSGWFTDAASIAAWGRREKYIDAPDSDLSWKAFNVGHAALADTAQPKYRGSFTVYDGDWRSNQRFALTSAIHGPAGGFTAEPFDTVRITRRYLSGTAIEAYDVEFGSPKGSFAAKHGKESRRADGVGPGSGGWGPGGGFGGGDVGGAGGVVDCGCPPFCVEQPQEETFTRTVAAGLGSSEFDGHPDWQTIHTGASQTSDGDEAVLVTAADVSSESVAIVELPFGMPVEAIFECSLDASAAVSTGYIWFGTLISDVVTARPSMRVIINLDAGDLDTSFASTSPGGGAAAGFTDAKTGVSDGSTFWIRMMIDAIGISATVSKTGPPGDVYDHTDPYTFGIVTDTPILLELGASGNVGSASTFKVSTITILQGLPESCGDPGAETPTDGQGMFETIGIGDGTTRDFATSQPFIVGSLQITVDNLPETNVAGTPSTGAVRFSEPPYVGEVIRARYQASVP